MSSLHVVQARVNVHGTGYRSISFCGSAALVARIPTPNNYVQPTGGNADDVNEVGVTGDQQGASTPHGGRQNSAGTRDGARMSVGHKPWGAPEGRRADHSVHNATRKVARRAKHQGRRESQFFTANNDQSRPRGEAGIGVCECD